MLTRCMPFGASVPPRARRRASKAAGEQRQRDEQTVRFDVAIGIERDRFRCRLVGRLEEAEMIEGPGPRRVRGIERRVELQRLVHLGEQPWAS